MTRIEMLPDDEHNRRLVEAVHPPAWSNPEPADRYHLVVIGAGTGGLVSAAIGAALGARVALVERHLMGGDCLNVGCVPSKALLAAARRWHDARTAASAMHGPPVSGEGDFAAVMERMRRLRADIGPHDGAARFRDLGIDVFLGEGRFTDPETVEVDGAELRFRRAIVATGGHAAAPSIPGLDTTPHRTNENLFELTALPRRLAILGAGPIGCEMAQAFARFGSRVTLIEAQPHILSREDPDASWIVHRALEADGVEIRTDARAERVEFRESTGERVVHHRETPGGSGREVVADELLVAVGRAPNVEGIGLREADVDFDPRAGIRVDERLQTTNRKIYAVGDVTDTPHLFTHASDHHARIAVRNALFFGRGRWTDLVIPWVTYTEPELARVGKIGREALAEGIEVDTYTVQLKEVDRVLIEEEAGFLRVHVEAGKDQIVGATWVGQGTGELIGEVTQAMKAGTGLGALGDVIRPYPTRGDALGRVSSQYRRGKLTPWIRKIFGLFFSFFR